jgi:hypothetical protein
MCETSSRELNNPPQSQRAVISIVSLACLAFGSVSLSLLDWPTLLLRWKLRRGASVFLLASCAFLFLHTMRLQPRDAGSLPGLEHAWPVELCHMHVAGQGLGHYFDFDRQQSHASPEEAQTRWISLPCLFVRSVISQMTQTTYRNFTLSLSAR